ncbi:MAG: hypothetical protein EOO77_08405 [Oxalobacteraceae bacterium]|nr:MAG: hypothetical protein EOO77_08405 [Oxalobacteraceae bacterium]
MKAVDSKIAGTRTGINRDTNNAFLSAPPGTRPIQQRDLNTARTTRSGLSAPAPRQPDLKFPEGVPFKARNYYLNKSHDASGSIKAREFELHLGFTLDNLDLFIARIHSGIKNFPATYAGKIDEANKCVIRIEMRHATTKSKWPVVSVWKDNAGRPKIITAYCET